MKKILFTDYSSGFGGSSAVLFDLLNNLDRQLYEPCLLIAKEGENFSKIRKLGIHVIKADVKVIGFSNYYGMNSLFSLLLDLVCFFLVNVWVLLSVIKKEKIDLVHVNNNIKHCIDVVTAARVARIPCICHIRETRSPGKMEKFFGKFVDRVIVLNSYMLNLMSHLFDPGKVRLIYDGLDWNALPKINAMRVRDEFRLKDSSCVGVLGRLVKGKGIDDFIQAAAIVKKTHKNVKFLVVGNDPDQTNDYQSYLKMLVEQLGLNNDVIFTGWRLDKFDIIEALDILVQPSSAAEGFGLTCIEAMALNKPVVATNVVGPSEIIENGKSGYLVDPHSPEDLAAAIARFLDSSQLRMEMGRAGRLIAQEKFDIKKNAKAVEDLYTELLK